MLRNVADSVASARFPDASPEPIFPAANGLFRSMSRKYGIMRADFCYDIRRTYKGLAERYDAMSALAENGSLAIEVDDTPGSFRKANGFVTFRGLACKQDEKGFFKASI